jgi:hypothetical protein
MADPVDLEARADDGALHRFWRFVVARRAAGELFDLEAAADVVRMAGEFDRDQDA